jgi:predicted nucleic acid-binding protein
VSALLAKKEDSPTVKILEAIFEGRIVPLYHSEILEEYNDVLRREKFHFANPAKLNLMTLTTGLNNF